MACFIGTKNKLSVYKFIVWKEQHAGVLNGLTPALRAFCHASGDCTRAHGQKVVDIVREKHACAWDCAKYFLRLRSPPVSIICDDLMNVSRGN